MSFNEILDAVEVLPMNERRELIRIIRQQFIEDERSLIAQEIKEANEELNNGNLHFQSVDDILNDIDNEL